MSYFVWPSWSRSAVRGWVTDAAATETQVWPLTLLAFLYNPIQDYSKNKNFCQKGYFYCFWHTRFLSAVLERTLWCLIEVTGLLLSTTQICLWFLLLQACFLVKEWHVLYFPLVFNFFCMLHNIMMSLLHLWKDAMSTKPPWSLSNKFNLSCITPWFSRKVRHVY